LKDEALRIASRPSNWPSAVISHSASSVSKAAIPSGVMLVITQGGIARSGHPAGRPDLGRRLVPPYLDCCLAAAVTRHAARQSEILVEARRLPRRWKVGHSDRLKASICVGQMVFCSHIAICAALALGATVAPALARPMPSSTALQVHVPPPSPAADDDSALAAKLQNPIGDLISVPVQCNANFNRGPNKGTQEILNIQPVIPIHLNEDWNLITRTTLPQVWNPSLQPAQSVPIGSIQSHLAHFSPAKASQWLDLGCRSGRAGADHDQQDAWIHASGVPVPRS
jgi:hypothetical protein